MNILGVRIDNLSEKEILEKVRSFLGEKKFHQIATINPEFILEAGRNEDFRNILNNCDLNVADGFGLKVASWRSGEKLNPRIAGADLMEEILRLAEKNNLKNFLVANSRGLSTWEEIRDAILKNYPTLKVSGINMDYHSGLDPESSRAILGFSLDSRFHRNDRNNINECAIVFCNFGAPYQEKFLHSLKSMKNSKIRLAMGVGGSFDYLTDKINRAPVFMRKIGLEWLWRLIQQPRRIKRIWNAVIIFPIKVIFSK